MSAFEKSVKCEDIAPLLVFYACNEVSDRERKQIDAHVASCPACAAQLAEESQLQEAMVAAPQPADELDSSGILLSQCRSELAEALDDLSAPPIQEHWRPFGWLRRWMALRPAWSGAVLVLFGIVVGVQVLPWLRNGNNGNTNGQAMNVMAKPRLTDDQLSKMVVGGINFPPSTGSGSPDVQLQLSAEEPLVLNGNVQDSDMRRVLTYVVENGERFDAGVRLDCLEALKAASRDQQVRQALIAAARKDQNPAVRMKALESLRDASSNDDVRQALLDALQHDGNPGVRVEAVNVLVGSLQHRESEETAPEVSDATPVKKPDRPEEDQSVERVVRALQQLQHRDPSRYVRLRSAAALRQIGPREVQ
ncbi:MAG TPA: HEAT repeat domain-containing protein [Candidatus Acidoferrales bacterium]|nr:HEAT repeat domain-containing protein [Candidatus Acidoferrales bacterium]